MKDQISNFPPITGIGISGIEAKSLGVFNLDLSKEENQIKIYLELCTSYGLPNRSVVRPQ